MSRRLGHTHLKDLIPENILYTGNPAVRAAAQVLSEDLWQIARDAENLILWARIDELEEPILTHLAYHLKVEFWDDDLTPEKKRSLIKSSIAWHRIKGTPAAVEQICEIVFGKADIREWFEYGGLVDRFKIETKERMASHSAYDRLAKLSDIAKNSRSVLEAITLVRERRMGIYAGSLLRNSLRVVLLPELRNRVQASQIGIGGVVRDAVRMTLTTISHNRVGESGVGVGCVLRKGSRNVLKPIACHHVRQSSVGIGGVVRASSQKTIKIYAFPGVTVQDSGIYAGCGFFQSAKYTIGVKNG